MLFWLLAGTVVFFVTVNVPALFVLQNIGVHNYAGSRDNEGSVRPIHGRANRARRNAFENYPVFMALGILALIVPNADLALASVGAQIFVIARAIYLPVYLVSVPYTRSIVWAIGLLGLVLMFVSLV